MSSVPKRVWVVLAISVALNLFCLGLFAARHAQFREGFRGRGQNHGDHGGEDAGPKAFLRRSGLRDAGPEVQDILKQNRQRVRDEATELRKAREQVQVALTAPQFDRKRVQDAFTAVRSQSSDMQSELHHMLTDAAEKLDAGQRAKLAEALWHHH